MSIKLGNSYWLLVDLEHDYVLGKDEYDAVKYCIFKNIVEEGGRVKYAFYQDINSDEYYTIDEWEIDQLTFKTMDEYLKYLVEHVDNISDDKVCYKFDNFLKQKITESQENNPEIWV